MRQAVAFVGIVNLVLFAAIAVVCVRQWRRTGLGLAIARSYARAHSGEVSYRPAAPRGAAFELILPASAAA